MQAQPLMREVRIRNPLEGIPRAQLMRDVEAFAEQRGLQEHLDMLKKGALVAQNPIGAHAIDGPEKLRQEELDVLEAESNFRWRLPIRLYLTIATCSIGAAVQGWDQTISNGVTIFPKVYELDPDNNDRDAIIVGLLNSGPYIGSAFVSTYFSGNPVADSFITEMHGYTTVCWDVGFPMPSTIGLAVEARFFRPFLHLACHWLGALPDVGGANGLPSTHGYWHGGQGLYCAHLRCRECAGIDTKSPGHVACGRLLASCLEPFLTWPSFYVKDFNWRLMLGAPFLPAVPLLVLIFLSRVSPMVARDIYYISNQLEIESQLIGKTNYLSRFTQLFTIPRVRRANLAAFTVMIAQQMCGINIIAFYSTTIFVDAGLGNFKAMIGSFGFGLVNWLFSFPAFWTIDTFGRRSLLLFTFPQMFWTLLVAGLCTLMPKGTAEDPNNARTVLVCLFVFLFGVFYSPGEGPVPFTYSAEVYPLSHRNWHGLRRRYLVWASVLGTSFPFLLKQLHTVGAFGLYAGFNIVAFIMILWVPETMQRTLEELDYVFSVPVRKFSAYQITETPMAGEEIYLTPTRCHQTTAVSL